MSKSSRITSINIAIYSILILGLLLLSVSVFYASSFLATLGVAMIFWSVILLYITPSTKHVPLALLNAATISALANIERTLAKANLPEKGRYLPPVFLEDFESSVVFISECSEPLPTPEEVKEEKLRSNKNSLFITPPGLALSRQFEKEIGTSFTKKDVDFVAQRLPKLLVEDMELAQNVELKIQGDTLSLEVTDNVLKDVCQETRNLSRTHYQVGCLLSSAVACVLAKASGEVVTIQKDEISEDGITRIEYKLETIKTSLNVVLS